MPALQIRLDPIVGRARAVLRVLPMLVFEQLIEPCTLLGREDFAELFARPSQFVPDLRCHRFHNLAAAFLALFEEFVDFFVLSCGEM